jgi:hypothetical protein
VIERAFQYFDKHSLPVQHRTERNALAFLILVESHKMTQAISTMPAYKEALAPYSPRILDTFIHTFKENSKKSRLAFFADEFVQVLWLKFKSECEAQCAEYFNEVAS